MKDMLKDYYRSLNVDEKVFEYCNSVEEKLKDRFAAIDAVSELNQLKVLKAMQDNRLSEAHFAGSSGYGYTDDGRDALERIYSHGGCPCQDTDSVRNPCTLHGHVR